MIEGADVEQVGRVGPLSRREDQILRLKATGMANIRVAHVLGISEQTVKNQSSTIYAKLGVDNLIAAMWVKGWVKLT